MASDDELRAKLTKALVDGRCCGGRGESMRAAYFLMPVVREALADAWDDGANKGLAAYSVDDCGINPWRGGDDGR